ncbi:MAG: FGGY family carbohydrate kinase, partial [Pseudomonadota bacterium]
MTLFLGIDVGTYQSKGVLVDETGEVVAEAARRHRLLAPRPGWAEHDPEADWWGDVAALSRELSDTAGAPEEIAAVAVSAIGPCVVGIGPDGRATTSGILYGVDTRASVEVSELLDRIGLDAVLARSGNGLDSQSGGPKILWLQRHEPEGAAAAVCFGTATTFIVNRLTGERVMDRYTAANYGPLWDADAQDWIHDLAPEINAQGRLPRLAWTSEIVGQITPQAAAETGLASGTPVTAGGIDAAAEAVSVGVRKPGDLMLM